MLDAALGTRAAADEAMTADRSELTYLVPRAASLELARFFDERLPCHHYRDQGQASRLAPDHFVTTVYFDTPSRRLLRAARSQAFPNFKLRAKEYYDVRSPPDELGAGAAPMVHAPGELWFELKQRSGVRTQKHRVRLSKGELSRWLLERTEPEPGGYVGREVDAQLLQGFLAAEPEPLSPVSLVNYQRSSWQSDEGELRVTLDSSLAFYVPPADLFQRRALLREELGAACSSEPRAVLEMKYRGAALPSAFAARLSRLGLEPIEHSKFVRSASAVEESTG